MDFEVKKIKSFPGQVPLPYYMSCSRYQGYWQERGFLQDMEYLQKICPDHVCRYRSRISQILDKMDYEGSMLYDEYPDYVSMRRLCDSIVSILQNEEPGEQTPLPDEGTISVLLCNEICKRRQENRRGNTYWMN